MFGSQPRAGSARAGAVAAALADPLRPGPYAVGAIKQTFFHRSVTTGELHGLDTVIWYPAVEQAHVPAQDAELRAAVGVDVAPGPFPVVVFSHAAASSPVQSLFLTTHLASHGFVVVAPSHPGTTWDDCLGCGSKERMQAMIADSAVNRPGEVSFMLDVLDAMNTDATSAFHDRLETDRAAVIGHSWGGYTAVMAAALDPRFQAAVAMAPVTNATLDWGRQWLHAPLLVMGSRLDDVTPYPPQERLFQGLPTTIPRYLLTFPLGGHPAYSEVCPLTTPGCRPGELGEARGHELVSGYVTAFLERYLMNDERYAPMLDPTLGGGDVEFTAGAGPR